MKHPFLLLQILLYGAAIMLMAACSPNTINYDQPQSAIYSDATYICHNAREFSAHFDRSGEKAALLFNGQSRVLQRVPSSPAYSDNFYTLYIHDTGFMQLERFNVPVMEHCTPYRA